MAFANGIEEGSERSESRQWPWVFRALWSSAPRVAAAEGNSGSATRTSTLSRRSLCHLELRVPDTILFEHGEPRKWVGSSAEGIVVRKPFFRACPGGARADGSVGSTLSSDVSSSEIPQNPTLAARILIAKGAGGKSSASSTTMDEFDVAERMDAIRVAFVSFAGSSTSPDTPLCVARYNDGSTELLSDKSLRTLSRFYSWRVSLSGLQAHVRSSRIMTGTYSKKSRKSEQRSTRRPQARRPEPQRQHHASISGRGGSSRTGNGVDRTEVESISSASTYHADPKQPYRTAGVVEGSLSSKLDQATMDIAFAADMSFALPESLLVGSGNSSVVGGESVNTLEEGVSTRGSQNTNSQSVRVGGAGCLRRPAWPSSRVCVTRLEAEFVMDQSGNPWFSNATRVLVQHVARQPKQEEDVQEEHMKQMRLKEEAASLAAVAARELRAVVTLARTRGLDAEEAFRHFSDGIGSDRAGKNEIIHGMASLGVALSEAAAALLIEMIVAGAETSASAATSLVDLERPRGANVKDHATTGSTGSRSRKRGRISMRGSGLNSRHLRPSRDYFTAKDLWCFAGVSGSVGANETKASSRPRDFELGEDSQELGRASERIRSHSPTKSRTDSCVSTASKRRRTSARDNRLHDGNRSLGTGGVESAMSVDNTGDTRRRRHKATSAPRAGGDKREATLESGEVRPSNPRTLSTRSYSVGDASARTPVAQGAHGSRSSSAASRAASAPAYQSDSLEQRDRIGKDSRVELKTAHRREELIYFPCEDPATEAAAGKDHVFHVDRYRSYIVLAR